MRFWEIDFFRGLAIALMVVFNYLFALRFFNIYMFDGGPLFWILFPRIVASMFIIIMGVSLTISYSRNKKKSKWMKYAVRGLKIFSLGLLVTAATYVFVPKFVILFGILHLMGISIILSLPFLRFRFNSIVFALFVIVVGVELSTLGFGFSPFFWFVPSIFYTLDYFPLLPWFGVTLLGLFLGSKLYKNGKRRFVISNEPEFSKPFGFLGRHSLIIYIIHLPVLVALLYLLGYSLF